MFVVYYQNCLRAVAKALENSFVGRVNSIDKLQKTIEWFNLFYQFISFSPYHIADSRLVFLCFHSEKSAFSIRNQWQYQVLMSKTFSECKRTRAERVCSCVCVCDWLKMVNGIVWTELFPTKLTIFIFIGYISLFISQGKSRDARHKSFYKLLWRVRETRAKKNIELVSTTIGDVKRPHSGSDQTNQSFEQIPFEFCKLFLNICFHLRMFVAGILVTASQDKSNRYNYDIVSVVLLTEVLKLVISIILYCKRWAFKQRLSYCSMIYHSTAQCHTACFLCDVGTSLFGTWE